MPDVVPLDYATVEAEVTARDREVVNKFTKDSQITAIRAAREYLPDRIAGWSRRTASLIRRPGR